MPNSFLCLAARAVIRDAQTNSISVFNIVEQITPQALPALIPDVAVVAFFWREAHDDAQADIPIRFRAVNNLREILTINTSINFRDTNLHRSIVTITPLLIHEPGFVEFTFARDNNVLASYRVEITPAVQAQVVQPPVPQVEANEPPQPPQGPLQEPAPEDLR